MGTPREVMRGPHVQSVVPDIPGALVGEGPQLDFLRQHVANLCQVQHTRFPGSQPVSFSKQSLEKLVRQEYVAHAGLADGSFWVCEKSDGQRVLMLIVVPQTTGIQEIYLINRKNEYYHIENLVMPMAVGGGGEVPFRNHTILDGELVVDSIAANQARGSNSRVLMLQRKLRLLLFDCMVMDGVSMADRPLGRRYARVLNQILPPYTKFMESNKHMGMMAPFEILLKPMGLAYGLEAVIREQIPRLQHGNDGLIFTNVESGYVHGTDNNILKWKPPNENTIDFKLRLLFPPQRHGDSVIPDLSAKPFFELLQHVHGDVHETFDWLDMSDDEWERWKAGGEPLNERIVECAWYADPGAEATWHIHRVRDDKLVANHKTTVIKIARSIRDGVLADELIEAAPLMRTAWKEREREKATSGTMAVDHCNSRIMRRSGPGPPLKSGGTKGLVRR